METTKKQKIFAIIAIISLIFFTGITSAKAKTTTYEVNRGDTLSKIGKKFNLNWHDIARWNKIPDPYLIFPGDVIVLNGKKVKQASMVTYSDAYIVVKGDTLSLIGQKFKLDWKRLAVINNIVDPYLIFPGDVIYLTKRITTTSKVANTALAKTKNAKQEKSTTKPAKHQHNNNQTKRKSSLPTGKVIPAKYGLSSFNFNQKESSISMKSGLSMFDIYSYSGYSTNIHKSAGGRYTGFKAKIKPVVVYHHGIKQEFGMFVVGEKNNGHSNDYKYKSNKGIIGITTGITTENYDFSFDVGIGHKYSKGWSGLYKSHQKDDIFYLSSYFSNEKRRTEKKAWLPEYNIGFWTNIPYHSSKKSSWNGKKLDQDPWDGQSYEMSFTQDIYDFKFKNNWALTPVIKLSYGHSWGDNSSYYGVLPGLKVSYKKYDILTVSAFGHTEELGGDNDKTKWFGLFVDIGNLLRAIKSSRITKYEPNK